MKRRRWLAIGSISLIGAVTIVWLYALAQRRRAESEFQDQLRFARAEGIPTTAAEFAALIKPCRPEENAAPLYRKLKGLYKQSPDPLLAYNLAIKPNADTISKAKAYVNKHRAEYAIIDQAVQKPRCWFNRDWSQGFAVLLPEYSDMKSCAKLLAFRSSLEAAQGEADLALRDFKGIQAILKHLQEEPIEIASLVTLADQIISIRALAERVYTRPQDIKYRIALKKAVADFTEPNDKLGHSGDLFAILWLVDAVKTPQGRASLGLKPDEADVPLTERLLAGLISRGKGKADIVKSTREMWAAYSLPSGKREDLLNKANDNLMSALYSEPLAARLFIALTGGGDYDGFWNDRPSEMWRANQQAYLALSRALNSATVPRSIKTDDLLSPFDGKPLTYKFDGKQIIIAVSGVHDDVDPPAPLLLKMPPDPPAHK